LSNIDKFRLEKVFFLLINDFSQHVCTFDDNVLVKIGDESLRKLLFVLTEIVRKFVTFQNCLPVIFLLFRLVLTDDLYHSSLVQVLHQPSKLKIEGLLSDRIAHDVKFDGVDIVSH
jgi:hypothetical protein